MKSFLKKYGWAVGAGVLLVAVTVYLAMDTFVISRVYTAVSPSESSLQVSAAAQADSEALTTEDQESQDAEAGGTEAGSGAAAESGTAAASGSSAGSSSAGTASASSTTTAAGSKAVSAESYQDGNISITITEYREYGTSIYVADVLVSSPGYLQTAFAQSAYGRNVTAKTSEIADSVNAILAINGDYYGSRETGYVIRNGVLYRDTAASGQEDLVIYQDGSFEIISEDQVSAATLMERGAVHVFSFGPALIENGSIAVSANEEVGKAKDSNPRTAIGILDEGHYVLVVSDGRTSESEGLSLSQLATFMKSLGVTTAYNLDGGGSSTMYFNGQVVNNPTTNGSTIKERSVSDIVYIGY